MARAGPSSPTFLRSLKKQEFLLSDRENVSGPPGTRRGELVAFEVTPRGFWEISTSPQTRFHCFLRFKDRTWSPKATRSFVHFSRRFCSAAELVGFQLLTSEREEHPDVLQIRHDGSSVARFQPIGSQRSGLIVRSRISAGASSTWLCTIQSQ